MNVAYLFAYLSRHTICKRKLTISTTLRDTTRKLFRIFISNGASVESYRFDQEHRTRTRSRISGWTALLLHYHFYLAIPPWRSDVMTNEHGVRPGAKCRYVHVQYDSYV